LLPLQPSLSPGQFLQLSRSYSVISLEAEVLADLESPASCYLRFRQAGRPSFLLESVEGGEKLGRYSTVSVSVAGILTVEHGRSHFLPQIADLEDLVLPENVQGDPFQSIDHILDLCKSAYGDFAGLIGALAYDSVRFIEEIPDLKVDQEYPEAIFLLTNELIVFDHLQKKLKLITNIYLPHQLPPDQQLLEKYNQALLRLEKMCQVLQDDSFPPDTRKILPTDSLHHTESIANWQSNFSQEEFEDVVKQAKEHIVAGNIFQIVPSQRFELSTSQKINPLHLYRLLRSYNPSPYLFLMDFGDFQLVGSSPEVMVKSSISSDSYTALVRPIAGTYRRGSDESQDQILAEKLKNDPKELAEHLMLIDLARNDLGRIAVAGTVKLQTLMTVEKYSHVLHLVSEVVCEVSRQYRATDLLKATFPAGTLSGAPKVRAMQLISQMERGARGFYGGVAGYLGFDGSCNTCMIIRTLTIKHKQKSTHLRLQAGGGVVYDSDPHSEYRETINKAAALLKVIDQIIL